MKKKFIVIILLFASIFTTACSALELNTEKAKIIEKQDSNNTTSPNTSKKSEKKNTNANTGTNNTDLDDKADVLQADTEEYVKSIIEERAMSVMTLIKNWEIDKLADAILPDKGVRFTRYSYDDVEKEL